MGVRPHSKWWLIGMYWLVQGLAIYFLTPIWIASSANVSPKSGNMGSVYLRDYIKVIADLEWVFWAAMVIPAVMLAQLVFLWPVRKPSPKNERGWPIWRSLGVAALAIGLLSTALMAAISQVINTYTGYDISVSTGIRFDPVFVGIGWCLASWAIATPLLIRFCKRCPRESLLARVASRLFTGTIIETAAIIPLDVLVRRRESCYCFAGTYVAMLMCGAVGVFILGPAILLPVLMRRRRRWYEGKCEWCGYDMRPTPTAERCPECGMGWRGEREVAE